MGMQEPADLKSVDDPYTGHVLRELFSALPTPTNGFDMVLRMRTAQVMAAMRASGDIKYDPNEFRGRLPDLGFFTDPAPALNATSPREYYNLRRQNVLSLVEKVEDLPLRLKAYECQLFCLFIDQLRRMQTSAEPLERVHLHMGLLEVALGDIYFAVCNNRYKGERYIIGMNDQGTVFTKSLPPFKEDRDKIQFFNWVHPHAATFMILDPADYAKVVPEGLSWSKGCCSRLPYGQEGSGRLGLHMLMRGQEHKHFHSSYPHEIIINDEHIKRMTVLDRPPHMICFSVRYADDTISLGVMSSPLVSGKALMYTPDLFADFIVEGEIRSNPTRFICDIAGSIAHDMFVCEERDTYFTRTEVREKKTSKKHTPPIKKYIWLPRYKVNLHGVPITEQDLESRLIQLGPSHVSGHIRKCENPSPSQLELAEKFGVQVPTGFTFVREHDRGSSRPFERQYRSRSAMYLFFGQQR